MKANYNYPKDEMEFYSRQYSVSDLIKNYKFPELMAYYLYGMNTLRAIQYAIDNNEYEFIERTKDEVYEDKLYFTMRTTIVKNALRKMDTCDLLSAKNSMFVCYSN